MKRLTALVIFSLVPLLQAYAGQEGQTKKIAIASQGETTDTSVSNRAGRCKYFLMFDKEGQLTEVLENPHRDALFSVGSETADLLAGKGVTLLVASNVGSRMIEALQKKEIAYIEFAGIVKDTRM